MIRAKISGWGKYIPSKALTNFDLEKMVDTSDEWITTRTGIKERHIAGPDESTSTMGAQAARIALEKAKVSMDQIDMVLVATMSPDRIFPATACLIQDLLKIPQAGTIDIEAACSGFLYALSLANAYVTSGMAHHVLVIGSDTMSRIIDWQDRNTCILFGDGAGAVVVSRNTEDDSGLIGFQLHGDGSYRDLLYMEAGGSLKPASAETVNLRQHYLKMNGNATFKVAVRAMSDILLRLLNDRQLSVESVDLLIPHQANKRIIDGVAERLGLSEQKVMINLNKYGNTSGATIPIALTEALDENRILKGDLVGFVALGGGFTWGSALMKW